MENKIKVYYYSYGLEKNVDPCYLLWMEIQKELEKEGYHFTLYEDNMEPDWNVMVNKIGNGEYDIGISAFYYTSERLKKTDFTYPFSFMQSSIKYYKPKDYFLIFFLSKVGNIILLLICIAILISYLYYKFFNNGGFMYTFNQTFPAFFGTTTGIINNKNKNSTLLLVNVLLYILIFYISVSIMGIFIAKTIQFKSFNEEIVSIKNKKIVISSGNAGIKYLKDQGAIPIIYGEKEKKIYKDSVDFYLANYKKYDALLNDSWNLIRKEKTDNGFKYNFNGKTYILHTSLIGSNNNLIGFPINKNKKEFVKKVQEKTMWFIFSDYGKICDKFLLNDGLSPCPSMYINPSFSRGK